MAMILPAASILLAQTYEVGAVGGFGFSRDATVTGPAGSGKAGLKNGVAAGGVLGFDDYRRIGGEFHYLYRMNDLRVKGGGQQGTFDGESHLIHYEFLFYSAPRSCKIRFFAAGGGGMRIYRGTGTERAYQPANRFAWLTKTRETQGMITAGGGVKVSLGGPWLLRIEARDYITPFPKDVITPADGAAIKGWLHDVVPTVGISYKF